MQFTPLQDFVHEESQSHYLVGLSYTVRPEDTKLASLVAQWMEQGKVKVGTPDTPLSKASVAGAGTTA